VPIPALLGFLRLYADPLALPEPFDPASPAATEVALHNPHTARSVLTIDGAPIGEVAPRGCVAVVGLRSGPHTAAWTTPAGFSRAEEIVATAPSQAGSSRSCAR
jgi:hypothetical protein